MLVFVSFWIGLLVYSNSRGSLGYGIAILGVLAKSVEIPDLFYQYYTNIALVNFWVYQWKSSVTQPVVHAAKQTIHKKHETVQGKSSSNHTWELYPRERDMMSAACVCRRKEGTNNINL